MPGHDSRNAKVCRTRPHRTIVFHIITDITAIHDTYCFVTASREFTEIPSGYPAQRNQTRHTLITEAAVLTEGIFQRHRSSRPPFQSSAAPTSSKRRAPKHVLVIDSLFVFFCVRRRGGFVPTDRNRTTRTTSRPTVYSCQKPFFFDPIPMLTTR